MTALHCLLVALVCAVSVSSARAEVNRGDGSQTGDGSTPFTGLAQAPEASLFVGAATTSIPIDVAPGRNSLTPKLALVYSSNAGPGPYGYGWDLPLGKIQRSTKHGVLSCTDPTYRNDFVLVLPGTSVEFRRDAGKTYQRANIEESFLRIEYVPATNSWKVWDKSGLGYYFGQTADAKTGGYTGNSRDFNPGDPCTYTFSWALTRIEDPNGNTLDIEYLNVQGALYPNRILYGGNVNGGLGHQFEVNFVWSDEDAFSLPAGGEVANGMGGFLAKLTKVLSRIEVRHPAYTTGGADRIRWYSLQYEFQPGSGAPGRVGRQSFLSAVTLYDRNDQALSRVDGLPASTTFRYHQNDPSTGNFAFGQRAVGGALPRYAQAASWPSVQQPSGSFVGRWSDVGDTSTTSRREIFDINGDGIPDLVDTTACGSLRPIGNPPVYVRQDWWAVHLGRPDGFSPTETEWRVPDLFTMCFIRRSTSDGEFGKVLQDTLDLNGDGIPDWVDGSAWSTTNPFWNVYLGRTPVGDGDWGFDSDPVLWRTPYGTLRLTQSGVNGLGWQNGTLDLRDLIDLNGDGLPDFVESPRLGTSNPLTVHFNTGAGFEVNGTSWAGRNGLRYTTDRGLQVLGIYDINGDGLPDQIVTWDHTNNGPPNFGDYSGHWDVFLNTGHGFTSFETWDLPRSPCNCWSTFAWNGLRQSLYDGTDVVRDFFDINGDGLPDVVDSCGFAPHEACGASGSNPYWTVYLNRGDGFAPAESWESPSDVIRDVDDHVDHAGGKTYRDVFDIDGDGLVDFVDFRTNPYRLYHSAGGAWCPSNDESTCAGSEAPAVAPDPGGARPDLLEEMENGLGGSTMLEYRPSTQWDNNGGDEVPDLPFNTWTVTGIERDDGMCDGDGANCTGVNGSAHSLVTTIAYEDGRFDPVAREFRGFFLVWSENDDRAAANHLGRATWFHQTPALSGKVIQSAQYAVDGGDPMSKPLTSSVNLWACADPGSGTVLASCPEQPAGDVWVRLASTLHYTYSNYGSSSRASVTANVDWQQCNGKYYGNVSHSYTGDALSSSTWVHTHTDYACLDNGSAYIVDKPTHVLVKDTGDTRALEEKWFAYDSGTLSKGNVTKMSSWLDRVIATNLPEGGICPSSPAGGIGTCVSTTMGYDGVYGNVTTVTDANGHQTSTDYDQATKIYPSTVTNALGHKVTTEYDPGCGKLVSQTITYTGGTRPSERSRREYDTFCRPVKIALPDEDIVAAPHQQIVYSLGAPQRPTVILTYAREPNSPFGGYVLASVFSDALGRVVQEKHQAVVDGSSSVAAGTTRAFDAHSNLTAQYAPFSGAGLLDIYMSPPTGTGVTTSEYDALGRVTKVTNPAGQFRTVEHNVAWQTTAKDECYNDPSCTGGKVIEKRDAFGHTVENQSYEQDTLRAKTQYTYDGSGRLLTTEQWDGTNWNANTTIVVQYDSLGRKIQLDDPDSGTWRYGYDKVGNLIYQDDPKSSASTPSSPQSTQFAYDAINRITAKYPMNTDGYCPVYVQCAPADLIEYHYDEPPVPYALGHLTRVLDESGATFFEQYDVRGRLLQQTKQIDAASRRTSAVTRYQYDVADHLTQITYPDGEVVRHGYNLAGQIISLRNTKATPTWYLNNLTYDVFGRPRVITHGNGTTDTRTYGTGPNTNYRLASIAAKRGTTTLLDYRYSSYSATGQIKNIDDFRTGSRCTSGVLCGTMTLTYDGVGRLTQASGPNLPTQNTYQYNALGNIILKEGITLTYGDPLKPHTLTAINGSAVSHDANGNRTEKPGQTYEYTADDRMKTIVVGGQSVQVYYDYTGQKVAQVKGTSVTRYYSPLLEVEPDGKLVKHYFAGGTRIASARVTPPAGVASLEQPAVMFAQVPIGSRALILLVRDDLSPIFLLAVGIFGVGLLLAPRHKRPIVGIALRHGHVIGVIIVFSVSAFPLPILVRPASAQTIPTALLYHYHLDHLGSPQAVTNASGTVLEYIRYKAFGEIRGRYTSGGVLTSTFYRHEFTGYETEWTSNLEYAGARWYDPALGTFLTHDPARQFASPYAYTNWDPVNRTDPNGEFVVELIAAIVIAAAVSGAVNTVIAAAQGLPLSQIGQAALTGAITGAVGVGLGVVASGLSVGLASLAGTLPQNVGLQEAMNALGEVAYRSAFSTIVADAAGRTATAAGAPEGAVIGLSIAAGYGASYVFDSNFIDYNGDLARIEGNGAFQNVSNTATHTDVTRGAAESGGFNEAEANQILAANLAQDQDLVNNQSHFGFGTQRAFEHFSQDARGAFRASGPQGEAFLTAIGQASHHLQDQYALGHILPGADTLRAWWGAIPRALIHQTIGGEITFAQSQYNASLRYFEVMRSLRVN